MSLIEPSAPPSALAPLSETRMTRVLSRSPVSSRKSSSRPIWASVYDRKRGEALHEAAGDRLLARARGRPTPAPTAAAATARCRPGSGPSSSWRAKVASRHASQPSSKWPSVALDPLPGRVVGRVARPGAEVEEEGLVDVDGPQVAEELDGLVGEIGAQVIARPRRIAAAGPSGCRGTGPARTGASRRRGSRTTGRSPGRAATSRRDAAMLVSSSGVRCHLPTA